MSAADYIGLAIWSVRDLHLPGAEREDVHQEALVGLVEAFRDYKPEHGITLATFVRLCARRNALDAIKNANRGKHLILTRSCRRGLDDDGIEVAVLDVLPDPRADVPALAEQRDQLLRIGSAALSALERRALIGVAVGCDYDELGPPKSIDNALQRARRKVAA